MIILALVNNKDLIMFRLYYPFVFFTVLILILIAINKSFASSNKVPLTPFPVSKPLYESYLKVSPLHEIWYAEYGNPTGVPVVVLHGGPGAGCNDDDMKYFDPKFWRIILLDQRGANLSKPFGEMKENTTQNLISDLEQLRKKLLIDKWLVFGGSWGSTLALAYGEAHPSQVLGFILRGIYLGRKSENEHLWYGMRDNFPDAWQEFNDFLPVDQQHNLINAYYQLVMNPDPNIAIPAARAFLKYDFRCSFLKLAPGQLSQFISNDQLTLGVSRAFIYYSINNFFLEENQLLNNIKKINNLPLIIVHGRYDMITLPKSAYELHKLWPGSELIFVDAAGHSAMEPGITLSLTQATEKMKQMINNQSNSKADG